MSVSGKNVPSSILIKKRIIPVPDTVLHVGSECNDGRPIEESWKYKEAIRRGVPIVSADSSTPILKPIKTSFTTAYKPASLKEVIGHKDSISTLSQWLSTWSSGGKAEGKAALVVGPPGIGKTTTVHLLAKEFGYAITEYNASDTRSVSMLRGLLGLGMKRLRKEIIIMDEVDGFTAQERGGVGELADLIRKSTIPIICIANQLVPKLAPLQKACLLVKFSRPVKSTIATALLAVCKKEGISKSKADLEALCEQNGNDIRSLLNQLEFGASSSEKDSSLRLDLFSATQKLMSNRRLPLSEAEEFVYVDYGMVPLMVQEAYLAASRTLDEAVDAAEQVSFGDLISCRQWKTQDWSLLPHVVHSTVATSRKISGPCPFQIFPKLLGKNATRGKHRRFLEDIARSRGRSASSMRLEETEAIQTILLKPLSLLKGEKSDVPAIQTIISRMDTIRLNRDQLLEGLDIVFRSIEITTKVKSMFTREYNKGHSVVKSVKVKDEVEEEADEEEEVEEEEIDD
jgi:replication factor C subunit 1